jgi:hypothetical protein
MFSIEFLKNSENTFSSVYFMHVRAFISILQLFVNLQENV